MGFDRRPDRRAESGVTLVELLVVLALLGVMTGMVGLSLRPGAWNAERTADDSVAVAMLAARHRALRTGSPVTITIMIENRLLSVTAQPDGRVVGGAALGLNALNGGHSGTRREQ